MEERSDNPYASPYAVQENGHTVDTPTVVLLIPFACLLIGLVFGVYNLIGVEEIKLQINQGTFVVAETERVASLGNWILAAAWLIGGVIASV